MPEPNVAEDWLSHGELDEQAARLLLDGSGPLIESDLAVVAALRDVVCSRIGL